jgi:hypothetical protein
MEKKYTIIIILAILAFLGIFLLIMRYIISKNSNKMYSCVNNKCINVTDCSNIICTNSLKSCEKICRNPPPPPPPPPPPQSKPGGKPQSKPGGKPPERDENLACTMTKDLYKIDCIGPNGIDKGKCLQNKNCCYKSDSGNLPDGSNVPWCYKKQLVPYKDSKMDNCLSDYSISNNIPTGCVKCNTLDDIGERKIYCDVLQTPGFVCNEVFNSFFGSLEIDGFNCLQAVGQDYYGANTGALQVAGKNYKNYTSNELIDRTMDLKVIKTILDLATNDNEKISVFLVQASLSFVNIDINDIISMIKKYENSTNPIINKAINKLIKLLKQETITKGKITGEDLGLYHSGLVFIKSSDYNKDSKKFPSSKIIASLELWANGSTGNPLWGSILPRCNKDGSINTSDIVNNTIVTTVPQVFGCTSDDFFGDYWNIQYYLGDTTKNVIVDLFSSSQKWLEENPFYIAQAVSSNYYDNCNGPSSSYIRSITCETFAIDMMKNLQKLDSTNFKNIFINTKFSEVVVIGNNYEILNNLTNNDIDSINSYTQNIEKNIKSIPDKEDNILMASPVQPAPTPIIGNQLNKLLSFGTGIILKNIAEENNTMYVVIVQNQVPKICKITSGTLKSIKIDIIYDECPARI